MALAVARLEELGIVHNDIKPPNTMVGASGVHIIDFGTACVGLDASHVNAAAHPVTPFGPHTTMTDHAALKYKYISATDAMI